MFGSVSLRYTSIAKHYQPLIGALDVGDRVPVWIYSKSNVLLGHIDFNLDSNIPNCLFIPHSMTGESEDEVLMLELFNLGEFIYRKIEDGFIELINSNYPNIARISCTSGLQVGSKQFLLKVSSHEHNVIDSLFGSKNGVTVNWPTNT
ncbi:hypothetical protein J7384_18505 [Endozoicomonas sp. G2_1]|uniref:hypothetical protein n=1 Tax=Endozoicomonas sp. G2_1 TaxID=2821091 RepID=UPI001ADBBEEC|nr:hypothetical protein [Endozoicomonas sp. G2_1]MBO9492360.1 hypothetical protein [Endozoicomonas sp. G2_1]